LPEVGEPVRLVREQISRAREDVRLADDACELRKHGARFCARPPVGGSGCSRQDLAIVRRPPSLLAAALAGLLPFACSTRREAVPAAPDAVAPMRVEFRRTARTHALLVALVGGATGAKETARLRAWELPLARHLALAPADARPTGFVRKFDLCGDLRRALIAPP